MNTASRTAPFDFTALVLGVLVLIVPDLRGTDA
jgi:hypothetical protein